MMNIKVNLFQWFINFFEKNSSGGTIKNENISSKKLAEELHKVITRKSKKRKLQSPFIDHIWGVDLGDMPLISKFNKGFIMGYWYFQ